MRKRSKCRLETIPNKDELYSNGSMAKGTNIYIGKQKYELKP